MMKDGFHRFELEEEKCDNDGNVIMPRHPSGYSHYYRYIRENIRLVLTPVQQPELRRAASFCAVVLDEIIEDNENSEADSRCFEDLEHLYQITNILKNPWSPRFPQEMIERAEALVEDDPGKTSSRHYLANALLVAAGAVLVIAGTLALCSGMGVFAGTFVAAAGAWLLGLAGLTAGTAVAVGVSAAAVIGGSAMALYGSGRLFSPQPTSRESLHEHLLGIRRPSF